jgi:hypothetical protein
MHLASLLTFYASMEYKSTSEDRCRNDTCAPLGSEEQDCRIEDVERWAG